MRLITFSNFQEHTTPIFKKFKILKQQDIIKFIKFKFLQLSVPLNIHTNLEHALVKHLLLNY